VAVGRPGAQPGTQPGAQPGARRGAAAGVIAKALTLLLLGVGVGAYHSIRTPITLRMTQVEPTTVPLPTSGSGSSVGAPAGEPPAGEANAQAPPTVAGGTEATPSGGADPGPGGTASLVLGEYIDLDTARQLWEHQLAEFIDARHLDEYVSGHITRAQWSDPRTVRSTYPEWANYMDPESSIIVIYCEGGTCDASQIAGQQLQAYGFKRVHIMREGFLAWKAAGLAVSVGQPGADEPAEPEHAGQGG